MCARQDCGSRLEQKECRPANVRQNSGCVRSVLGKMLRSGDRLWPVSIQVRDSLQKMRPGTAAELAADSMAPWLACAFEQWTLGVST